MKQDVTLAEVIQTAIDSRLLDLHTAIVGRVEAVDAAARKVDVRPVMLRVLRDEEGGLSTEELPIIPGVPLAALRAGTARIDMPVQAGHWVVVLCFEENVGKWIAQGGVKVSPGDVERHGLTGAVAIPFLYPDTETSSLPALSSTDIVLAITGGPQLRVTPTAIVVTGDLQVSGEVTAKSTSIAPIKLSNHTHNTAMGPSGVPNPT